MLINRRCIKIEESTKKFTCYITSFKWRRPFGFSEQASAASPQSYKVEVSTENRGIASYKFSFYDLSDLRGTEFFTLTPGSAKNFLGNDDISSIEMPPSSYIILYSDLNYEGYEKRIENRSKTKYKTVNLDNYYMGILMKHGTIMWDR